MSKVKVLRAHAQVSGVGIWRIGEEYEESPSYAEQKVRAGFVEYADGTRLRTKQDPDMYATRSFSVPEKPSERPPVSSRDGLVTLAEKSGNWYVFSDGEKMLGKRAASDHLGITIEELGELDVDTPDQ